MSVQERGVDRVCFEPRHERGGFAFAAALQPGPLQAYLLASVAQRGWKRTLPAALSPLLSDGPIILVVLLVLTRLPDSFRSKRRADWTDANKPGHKIDSFLEGPAFDRAGDLFVVDIPFGRIFRVVGGLEWTLVAEYVRASRRIIGLLERWWPNPHVVGTRVVIQEFAARDEAAFVVHEVPDPAKLFREIALLLKPGQDRAEQEREEGVELARGKGIHEPVRGPVGRV